MTARGRLFRSEALSSLTEQDVATLLDLGLTTVVDLRNSHELEASPGVFATDDRVRYHHNPVARLGPTHLAPHERLLGVRPKSLFVARNAFAALLAPISDRSSADCVSG